MVEEFVTTVLGYMQEQHPNDILDAAKELGIQVHIERTN